MHPNFYAAVFFGLFNAALSLGDNFDPVFRPRKGETVHTGSTYTIKWQSVAKYDAGPIDLFLQTDKETDNSNWVQVISPNTVSDTGEYKWNVSKALPSGDDYYIKIGYINDVSIVNFSPRFKIQASSNLSSTVNSTSLMSTGLPSSTVSTSIITISTSSPASSTSTTSVPTSTSSAAGAGAKGNTSPFALLVAAGLGFVAL